MKSVQALQQQHLFELSNLGSLANLTFKIFTRGRVGLGEVRQIPWNKPTIPPKTSLVYSAAGFADRKLWLGKTHLAAAIANEAVAIGMSTIFLTVPDLLDWLRSSYSSSGNSNMKSV